MKYYFTIILLSFFFASSQAQSNINFYAKSTTTANRAKLYNTLVRNSIIKNLSLPLTDTTEADWQEAFYAIEFINYQQPWINEKITTAVNEIENHTPDFQRALLELLYSKPFKGFSTSIKKLLKNTGNAKIFAMCAEYLMLTKEDRDITIEIPKLAAKKFLANNDKKTKAIISSLMNSIIKAANNKYQFGFNKQLFEKNYFKNNVVVYSIQRKNRNYPGIVILKDTAGNFVKDNTGKLFNVPQLARSINNLPSYLTNGNTPQGVFRMFGIGISKLEFIGPTENLQLTMPFETSMQHFLKDSTIMDSVWTTDKYSKLLPSGTNEFSPLFQTYFASKAGRTEIIAHGTTVNPEYYKGQSYYPLTPTEGCLCTKEMWSGIDGKRTVSNQQKLVDAVKKAGGADGYLIVIEIDDSQKPVSINEILPYLK